jgi:hypothetical protein
LTLAQVTFPMLFGLINRLSTKSPLSLLLFHVCT